MAKTNKEIKEWLEKFANDVFENAHRNNAEQFNERLNAFIKENNVSPEQMQEFAESGAGEELYMLSC